MHHPWNNHPIDVGENLFDRLANFRRLARQLLRDHAGSFVRRDGKLLNVFAVIGNPICKLMQVFAKRFRRNIAKFGSFFHLFCSGGLRPSHFFQLG